MPNDSFKTRLEKTKKKINKNKNDQKNQQTSNFGEAFKLSTELVAAVAVGTIIGFILDNWFGTKPWLILIFFFAISKRVEISLRFFIFLIFLSN